MDKQQRIHQIFNSFRKVHQGFYQTLLKAAQRQGLTPVQSIVLKTLSDHPRIGLSELADLIYLSSSTTSGIVDRMVKAGLVTRERSDTDRRSVLLSLTDKGATFWQHTFSVRMNLLSPLLELSEEDQHHLIRIHDQIENILERVREE